MLVIDGEPEPAEGGREGRREARLKTILNDDAVGPAAVASLSFSVHLHLLQRQLLPRFTNFLSVSALFLSDGRRTLLLQ